jgi:hypothetical protein
MFAVLVSGGLLANATAGKTLPGGSPGREHR